MSPLKPSLSSVTGILADAYAPQKPKSRWYCDDTECNGKPHGEWEWNHCRKNQRPPDGDWYIWLLLSGRGFGKSRCAAEWIVDQVADHPRTEWGVIGPTSESVRKCAEDLQAGITNIAPAGLITKYNRTLGDIFLSNGAIIHLISADKPDRLRGFNLAGAWCDEVSSWRYPDAWDLGLLPAIRDARVPPRIVVTTTPKPVELVRRLANRDDPRNTKTRITYGSTFDNADNLPPQALDELRARYDGTRKGRQELYGELLLDVDGALVDQDMIDDTRLREMPPNIRTVRTVVAVDPATTSGERSDETGIIVCSRGADGRGYILADLSCKDSPDGWARKVVGAYERFHADRVVLEKNQGGEAWETIIRSIHPNISFKAVNSGRKGKYTRAEPVAALYEQGKISHVGIFEELEDQLTTWVPGETGSKSPDHLDALVYGIIELGLVGLKSTHLREAMEEAHPPCMVCGMPAPKGTPRCPKCGTALDGDGTPVAPAQAQSWNPHGYGPSPIQPDPTTRAVMDMLREVLPQQKFGPGRFGR